jgi:TolA-binding protein
MRIASLILACLALLPAPGLSVNKEHEAIMREIQALSAEVQKLQKLDERVLELRLLLQQTLDMATKANTSVSLLERDMKERMREQEKTLVAPVSGLGSKVDQMADEFRFVKENMSEVNSRVGKLQTKLVDVENAVKTIQLTPPPPPPSNPQVEAPKPTASLNDLYEGALKDLLGGKYDLAMAGFNDVLKYYPKSERACASEYYIGDIHYRKEKLEEALVRFESVVDNHGEDCDKHADAMYMKAKTLGKGGERTKAGQAYRELKTKHPQKEWLDKANAGLRELGLSTGAPAANTKKRAR